MGKPMQYIWKNTFCFQNKTNYNSINVVDSLPIPSAV